MSNRRKTKQPLPTLDIRTNYNFALGDRVGDVELPDPKSLTMPGMSVPLKTLLERYMQGREIQTHQPLYEGHLNIPDVRKMSKVDKEMLSKDIRNQISNLRQTQKEEQSKAHENQIQKLQKQIETLTLEKEKSHERLPSTEGMNE